MYNVLLRSCGRGECNRGWEGEREREVIKKWEERALSTSHTHPPHPTPNTLKPPLGPAPPPQGTIRPQRRTELGDIATKTESQSWGWGKQGGLFSSEFLLF